MRHQRGKAEQMNSTNTYPATGILSLGPARIASPLEDKDPADGHWVSDDNRVCIPVEPAELTALVAGGKPVPAFEMAGPRRQIYFDPSKLRCALVTCGGLCPGLNDIIRAIVLELFHNYGVRKIYGIRYGLQGFIPRYGHDIMDLTPASVSHILDMGGSILGSSRGPQPIEEIIDSLERMNVGILFMIGGDGTLMAADRIADAILARNLKIAVVCIPKTIDNDIYMVARSFGFDTAVDEATRAIRAAHNEALGYPNGIGLLKLMGRQSGFIAAAAALAKQEVNFVLIPEVDFDLEGEGGLLAALEKRLKERRHAVVVVAEGAGQKFFCGQDRECDPSGNVRLEDIGLFLKERISDHFQALGIDTTIKYIDPSYLIRSREANANDSVFCGNLGRDAVHAGMAGKTRLLIGYWNNYFVHIPMAASAGRRKKVDPNGRLWQAVLNTTGQGTLRKA
jgi:6-phosphofructokinase 1